MRWRRTRRGHCLGRTRTPLPPGASLPSRRAPSPAPPSATCLGGNPSCGCGERDELEHWQGKGRGSRSARNSACSDLHRVGCAACARRVRRRRGVAIAGARGPHTPAVPIQIRERPEPSDHPPPRAHGSQRVDDNLVGPSPRIFSV